MDCGFIIMENKNCCLRNLLQSIAMRNPMQYILIAEKHVIEINRRILISYKIIL